MPNNSQIHGGILLKGANSRVVAVSRHSFLEQVARLGMDQSVEALDANDGLSIRFRLSPVLQREWARACGTLQLSEKLRLHPLSEKEVWRRDSAGYAVGTGDFRYPGYPELAASVRIRQNIAEASRRTSLSFHTSKIERPTEFWRHSEECGFTVLPGKPLIEALRMATQPEASGQQYSFSCYRATEYVILLAIAQELVTCNPELLHRLQLQWESPCHHVGAISPCFFARIRIHERTASPGILRSGRPFVVSQSGRTFLRRHGLRRILGFLSGQRSVHQLVEEQQALQPGFEMRRDISLAQRGLPGCHGRMQMDESIVEERVRATLSDPDETAHILESMMRLRDPSGVYADGGCIDTTREYPRWVCHGTSDIVLPEY